MLEILKIEKDSSLKIDTVNEIEIPDNLYKKCSFRKNDNFINIYNINYKNYIFEVWGKNKGKENQLNNFNFTKYFSIKIYGNCIILLKNNNYINFDMLIWQKLFNEDTTNIIESDSDNSGNEDMYSIELNEESFIYTSEDEIDNK